MERVKIEKTFSLIRKKDIVRELFFSGIGCLFFMIIVPFFPKKFWDEEYRTTLILLILLTSLLAFTLLNQVNSKKKIFNIDYNRNVIIFSIIIKNSSSFPFGIVAPEARAFQDDNRASLATAFALLGDFRQVDDKPAGKPVVS